METAVDRLTILTQSDRVFLVLCYIILTQTLGIFGGFGGDIVAYRALGSSPMAERIYYLFGIIKEKIVRLVRISPFCHKELALQRAEMHKKSYHEQAVLFTMERKNQLMSVADKIIEGKRKKRGEPFDEKEALNEEIRKIPQMTEDFMMVQLFTRPHWKLNGQELLEMPYPNHSSIRCLVFIDLWDKGYYLTAGEKFGGDFLVYPGDPVKFHSHYIAVCISEDEPLNSQFLISKGRLGTNVKKTVLLCSVDAEGQMMYQSLQWESAIKQVK
nr:EOG090X0G6M [Sida crystallina]